MNFGVYYDALEFFKHNWTLEILNALTQRPRRFNELKRSVVAVNASPFNATLHRLVEAGLVRHPSDGDGRHYTLTDQGAQALPLLRALIEGVDWWKHNQGSRDADEDDRTS